MSLDLASSSDEIKEESTASEDPGKERTPSPPLKANGLRIKVGNRRNSGPSPPPPPTEADVLVNFDPKPLPHDLLSDPAPASCDRSELEMESSLGKQLSSSTEDHAEQVLSVTQESSASKPISNSPGHGEQMASPSQPISFQPPLPTSAPSPPPGRQLLLNQKKNIVKVGTYEGTMQHHQAWQMACLNR